jgi:hypothetical protein
MTSGTSGGGLLGGEISLSISDRCLGGGDLSVFPSGFFSAAFSSSSVGVFDHCNVSMTLDSVLGYLCLAYDRGLCRSASAERDILTFICSSRSGKGGSSLGSGGGVTSLSGEGRGGRSGTFFCFSSVAVSFDDGSGREEQGRMSLSTTSRTLFLLADFSLMGFAGGDGHLAGVWGGSDSSTARALLLVGVRGPTSVAALGGVVATTMGEMFSSYTGVGDVRVGLSAAWPRETT